MAYTGASLLLRARLLRLLRRTAAARQRRTLARDRGEVGLEARTGVRGEARVGERVHADAAELGARGLVAAPVEEFARAGARRVAVDHKERGLV